ncbi:MAG: metal-dependent transcriptional regulator [Flavobacteriaceae bacterium]
MTRSEENYLKAIYHLGKTDKKAVATNAISEQMDTKPSSVTDMLKRLSEKGMVNYRKYQGVQLTEKGRSIALSIIRKHRLWEVFLVEKLGFSWDEVHEVAEQLEHVHSEKLIDELDRHLGYPTVDPHGDPIPTKTGEIKKSIKKPLSDLEIGHQGICVGVKDSSPAFLKFLDKYGITLGHVIRVIDVEEFDGSFHIQIEDRQMHISDQIANNLYIEIN